MAISVSDELQHHVDGGPVAVGNVQLDQASPKVGEHSPPRAHGDGDDVDLRGEETTRMGMLTSLRGVEVVDRCGDGQDVEFWAGNGTKPSPMWPQAASERVTPPSTPGPTRSPRRSATPKPSPTRPPAGGPAAPVLPTAGFWTCCVCAGTGSHERHCGGPTPPPGPCETSSAVA